MKKISINDKKRISVKAFFNATEKLINAGVEINTFINKKNQMKRVNFLIGEFEVNISDNGKNSKIEVYNVQMNEQLHLQKVQFVNVFEGENDEEISWKYNNVNMINEINYFIKNIDKIIKIYKEETENR